MRTKKINDYAWYNNATITQGFLYAPFGEITTEYTPLWQNGIMPNYTFNAKELDEETGMYYYEARYYNPPVFVSRDRLFEKYPWMSPYSYCMNNPVGHSDPTGCDTVNISYNTQSNKWEIGETKIAEGNDVFNVTGKDGVNSSYTFSEGEYGNRINMLMLEDEMTEDVSGRQTESLGIYHQSGTSTVGYYIQPSSNAAAGYPLHKQLNKGCYSTYIGKGSMWTNYIGLSGNGASPGVRIHYGIGRSWSTGCVIISSDYSVNSNGARQFDLEQSRQSSWQLAQYAGAISKNRVQMGRVNRYRDKYEYGTFSSPKVILK